jgi:hypothetical protein
MQREARCLRLETTAGAPKNTCRAAGVLATNDMMRDAERELARQVSYSGSSQTNEPARQQSKRARA